MINDSQMIEEYRRISDIMRYLSPRPTNIIHASPSLFACSCASSRTSSADNALELCARSSRRCVRQQRGASMASMATWSEIVVPGTIPQICRHDMHIIAYYLCSMKLMCRVLGSMGTFWCLNEFSEALVVSRPHGAFAKRRPAWGRCCFLVWKSWLHLCCWL